MQEETEGGSDPSPVPDATFPCQARAEPAGGARERQD